MCDKHQVLSEKKQGYTCVQCQTDNEMPNVYCCLCECGEHEFCIGCKKGIYLCTK